MMPRTPEEQEQLEVCLAASRQMLRKLFVEHRLIDATTPASLLTYGLQALHDAIDILSREENDGTD